MKNRFLVFSLLFCVFLIAGSVKQAQSGEFGPFYLPALGADETIRTVSPFVAADEHENSDIIYKTAFRWVNIWVHHIESDEEFDWQESDTDTFPFKYGSYLVDIEIYTLTNRLSYKIKDGLSAEISIPFHYYGGGCMDGFIEGFHKTFGINQHNRTDADRDQTQLFFVTRDGTLLYEDDSISGFFVGNIEVGASWTIWDRSPALSFRTIVKLPTSQERSLFDQNGFDFTFQTLMSWHCSDWSGYHGIGITRFGSSGNGEIDFYRLRGSTMNTFEYHLTPKTSLILHTVTASPTADYPEFDSPVVETTLGFKRKVFDGIFEFGLIENLFFFDNSPDFGIHAGYTMNF